MDAKVAASKQSQPHQRRPLEATMELRMRMNVLAAIMSFSFVAAIVLGMI